MRESRTYGSVRGARDETRVPTATRSPITATTHFKFGHLKLLQASNLVPAGTVLRGTVRANPLLRDELACRAFITRTLARLQLDVEPSRRLAAAGEAAVPTNRRPIQRNMRARITPEALSLWARLVEIHRTPRLRENWEPDGRRAEYLNSGKRLCTLLGLLWFDCIGPA